MRRKIVETKDDGTFSIPQYDTLGEIVDNVAAADIIRWVNHMTENDARTQARIDRRRREREDGV